MHELNGVIGMAKKCCFCCHELARRLALAVDDTEMKFKFTVAGTSGTVQYPYDEVFCEVAEIHCRNSETDPE